MGYRFISAGFTSSFYSIKRHSETIFRFLKIDDLANPKFLSDNWEIKSQFSRFFPAKRRIFAQFCRFFPNFLRFLQYFLLLFANLTDKKS